MAANTKSSLTQICPICGDDKRPNPRYPLYLCYKCSAEASDESGRKINFQLYHRNGSKFVAGFHAVYSDTGELRNSDICYIRGTRCLAEEAYFGGVVIQITDQYTMSDQLKINSPQAYFIKLGKGGSWESECIRGGYIRVGFNDIDHGICVARDWDKINMIYVERGIQKGKATHYSTELKRFYSASEQCLWVTFSDRKLWWGFAEGEPYLSAEKHKQRNIKGGWKSCDLSGVLLDIAGISSKLTQVTGYQGTICEIKELEYLLRKINSDLLPEVRNAQCAREAFLKSIVPLVKNLTWRDFETLVDMVFTARGWRRLGVVGKTEKDIDLELEQPVTKELVMVQIKARCGSDVVREISLRISGMTHYKKVFIVTHSFTGKLPVSDIDSRIEIMDVDRLSPLILDAGLSDWLIVKSK
jgi:hypothetical protein